MEPENLVETESEIIEEIEAEPNSNTYWNIVFGYLFSPIFGWSLLLFVIIIVLLWNKIHAYLDRIYVKRQQRDYDAKCHKDPDWVMGHYERMEAARRKMQDQYNVQAAVHQEKVSEREKVKKLEKLTKCTTLDGHRLGNDTSSSQTEYKPLDGHSGGRFRPTKKSTCSGGGCG